MTVMPLPLPTSSNPGRYGHDSNARLINCFAENTGPGSKNPVQIFASDGLTLFSQVAGTGFACRGLIALDGYMLAVLGSSVYTIDTTGAAKKVGGILGTGPATLVRNEAVPFQVAIVSDGQRYFWNGSVLQVISDPDLPAANSAGFIDNYVLYGVDDGRFFWADLNTVDSINSLSFGTASASPDRLVRLFVRNREVWLMGQLTTEIWTDTGDATQPFQRLAGAVLMFGLGARESVQMIRSRMFFVDHNGIVVMSDGYNPTRISSHAVERAIASVDWSAITSLAYVSRGHQWYVLNSPSWTWVWDDTTGYWHEQASFGLNRRTWEQYCFFNGQHVVGDYASGAIYQVSPDAYDEAGVELPMVVQTQIHNYPKRLKISSIYLDTVPGTGVAPKYSTQVISQTFAGFLLALANSVVLTTLTNLVNADNVDPKVSIKRSLDGGFTWGPERFDRVGKAGERLQRVRIDRWGLTKEDGMVFRIGFSAAVARGISSASIDAEEIGP
jgi:hypothetical protein